MRGGTSKGVLIQSSDLPPSEEIQDKILLRLMGSPDLRQIDGLGGGDVLTSKVEIVSPSEDSSFDVNYTHCQIGIDEAVVWRDKNCGNMAAAVAAFAVEKGWLTPAEPVARVRIYCTNTQNILRAEVPVQNGSPVLDGDFVIDGVPGSGAKILLDWYDFAGSSTGKLFPTGNRIDSIRLDGVGVVELSLIDLVNLTAFVRAESLGLQGDEDPLSLARNDRLMKTTGDMRKVLHKEYGLTGPPFISIVSSPRDYRDYNSGKTIRKDEVDLVGRVRGSMVHKAYAVSVSAGTAVAALLPGTVVRSVMDSAHQQKGLIRIGHPQGVLCVECQLNDREPGKVEIERVAVGRTARKLMEGYAYVSVSKDQ